MNKSIEGLNSNLGRKRKIKIKGIREKWKAYQSEIGWKKIIDHLHYHDITNFGASIGNKQKPKTFNFR